MIGQMFYKYDGNKRVYNDPETGERSSSPIFKYAFNEWYVIGETTRSWLLSTYKDAKPDSRSVIKFPKSDNFKENGYLTESERNDSILYHDNYYRTVERARNIRDWQTLKELIYFLDERGVK
jgi:hypothetical protein